MRCQCDFNNIRFVHKCHCCKKLFVYDNFIHGPTGPTGFTGAMGPSGINGSTGATGPTGEGFNPQAPISQIIVTGTGSFGSITLPNILNASSLATDANGNIIAGTGSVGYSGLLNPGVITSPIFDTTTDLTYVTIDSNNRIVHLWLNFSGVMNVGGTLENGVLLNIQTNPAYPSPSGTLPPIRPEIMVNGQMFVANTQYGTNAASFFAYTLGAKSNTLLSYIVSGFVNVVLGEMLQISGYLTYPY